MQLAVRSTEERGLQPEKGVWSIVTKCSIDEIIMMVGNSLQGVVVVMVRTGDEHFESIRWKDMSPLFASRTQATLRGDCKAGYGVLVRASAKHIRYAVELHTTSDEVGSLNHSIFMPGLLVIWSSSQNVMPDVVQPTNTVFGSCPAGMIAVNETLEAWGRGDLAVPTLMPTFRRRHSERILNTELSQCL